jgi:SpoVK/Ycf46/Vps4 family AAA+-type ATPase
VRVRDSLLNLSPRIPSPLSSGSVQTERRLREIFSEARRRAPALIFIDEIDALCPSRERAPNDLEKRIVATMLTLMDGANTPTAATAQSGHVLVIGATNRPDALDPAIRRPGRFDREIEIGIPNATGRREILDALLRNTPHSIPAGAVGQVAAVTHGYVGADLAAVCNEAGMLAARRAIESTKAGGPAVPAAITEPDLRAGLQRVRPSAMREVYVDVPTVRWTDIGGQDGAKQELREAVEWPLKHPEAFTRMGIRAPRGILLYGPPGCSKTLMAKALATESSLNFLAVKGPEVFSKWVGESEKAVQAVFRKARAVAPSIVFFDEIDAIAGQRQEDGGGGGVGDRVLSQLLSEMDGVEALHNVTVVAATNRPDIIDTALLRPGRIDRMVYVGPPDRAAREQILTRNLRDVPCADSVDVAALAVATDGCSGAEVVAVCREGALQAMKEDPADAAVVEHRHFVSAVAGLNRTITAEMLAFYDNYRAASR